MRSSQAPSQPGQPCESFLTCAVRHFERAVQQRSPCRVLTTPADEKSKVLESLLVNWSASKAAAALRPDAATNGGKDQITTALSQLSVQDGASAAQQDAAVAAPPAEEVLTALLDLSLLKFQDKDRLVEALQHYRTKTAYDMVQAWDTRARKFYGDRYDARRNMVSWTDCTQG